MILADTSGLLALFNEREPRHQDVRAALDGVRGAVVVSPYVAELDHLVGTRIGVAAELAVLRELAGPAYELAEMDAHLLSGATDLVESYADQRIGLTDASIVVLAGRYRTDRILTLDRRHFGVLRASDGGVFTLLP